MESQNSSKKRPQPTTWKRNVIKKSRIGVQYVNYTGKTVGEKHLGPEYR